MAAISNRLPEVNVEYDFGSKGQRRTKQFDDANAAKVFYEKKETAGKNPKVVKQDADTGADKPAVVQADTAAAADQPKLVGVTHTATRPYYAGVVVRRHGVDAGVTDAMVAEVDQLYGRPNPRESTFCLKNAWHAVRGFNDK